MPPQLRDPAPVDGETTTMSPAINNRSREQMRRITSGSYLSEMDLESPKKEYRVQRSSLIGMINWMQVIGVHLPTILCLGLVVLLGQVIHQIIEDKMGVDVISMKNLAEFDYAEAATVISAELKLLLIAMANIVMSTVAGFDIFSPAVKTTAILLIAGAWFMRKQNPVYLMSFATFKAPDSWKVSHDEIIEIMRRQRCFKPESLEFLNKILQRSGTGQATAWPPGIVQCMQGENVKSDRSIEASRQEAQTVIFDVVQKALDKAGLQPREIDILIINCSLFSPTPSLCAMVVNQFNMRSNVVTYNLSGMGCAASLISVDLAKQLLATGNRNKKALVVSTEVLTPNFYHGNERGFLIQNTLFRCGGAAMVLSNSWGDGRRAWYKLLHTVRVQGNGEAAYQCVYETECQVSGERGVRLSKDIVKVAGKCMEKNFTQLGPSVLPLTEQARVVMSIITRYLLKTTSRILTSNGKDSLAQRLPSVKPYVPDFKRGIDHFCIHAGGRAVIDGIESNMKLETYHTEASRATLYNYGNTSSSSIWYELEYIQDQQTTNPLKKGDRILQVAFGSGFKCTSGVWLKL